MSEWQVFLLQMANLAKWGSITVASPFVLQGLYRAGRGFYDDVSKRYFEFKQRKLTLEHIDDQNKLHRIRTIESNEHGRYPLLVDRDGTIRNPNTQAQFTIKKIIELYPFLEKGDLFARLLEAAGGWPSKSVSDKMMDNDVAEVLGSGVSPTLGYYTITGLMKKYDFTPTLHSVLIGEYVDEAGEVKPLTLDIPVAVHVINTGSSGLGKSTLAEAIAIQLATLPNVKLAAMDGGTGSFDRLESHLGWEIAYDQEDIVMLMKALIKICHERKAIYRKSGLKGIKSLFSYNEKSGENLPYIFAMIDEVPVVLARGGKEAQQILIELARLGRKYGIGLILSGTDFNVNTLPNAARGNFRAIIAFWLKRGLSVSMLGDQSAYKVEKREGCFICELPNKKEGRIYGQAPDVTDADYVGMDPGEEIPTAIVGVCKEMTSWDYIQAALHDWMEDKIERGEIGEGVGAGALFAELTHVLFKNASPAGAWPGTPQAFGKLMSSHKDVEKS